jgi:nucleoid-associated protein YgaU
MTGTFTARAALLLLTAVVAIGGLIWWMINHRELLRTSSSPAQVERSTPPAPVTEATEAVKDLGRQVGVVKPGAPERGPQFDVVRVEPNGDSVIAGRATPNATVELLRDGDVHDRTVADPTGAFVLVPKPLPPGKYELKLRATEPDGRQMVSGQSVAVELGSPAQDKTITALTPSTTAPAAPQKPARPSAAPPAAAQPKPATPTVEATIRIELAEAQDGGKLYVSGRSAPGASVRLYLNDAFIATGTASSDGQVSFFIGGGVKPGEYRIRLDQIDAAEKVIARAEVPFTAPATLASSAPAGSAASRTSVAASQPQPAAPAPQAAALASPIVAADPKPSAPGLAARPASPPMLAESGPVKTRAAPEAGNDSPRPSAAPAALEPAPRAERPAAPALAAKEHPRPQTAPTPQAESLKREIAGTRSDPTSSARSPDSSAPAAKDGQQGPAPASPLKSAAANGRTGTIVVPNIDTKVVIRGDNLWQISRTTYGHGIRYTVIYKANRDQIRDPDLIYPGQIFVLPKSQP